jgi:MFS family permease
VNPDAFSLRRIAVTAFGPSLLFGLGEGAVLPVIALGARELGASVATAALIVTLIGIGSLLTNLPASLITARRGERWSLVAAALWGALAIGLCAWARHVWMFALGTFMIGMAQAVFSLARQSYLAEVAPATHRARAMSMLGGVLRIGLFVGPLAGAGAIHGLGLSGAYGVGMAALVLAGLIAARMPDVNSAGPGRRMPTAIGTDHKPSWIRIIQDHRHAFLTLGFGVILVGAVRASRQAILPLWAEHLALDPAMASLIYGAAGGIEMLVFYPAGKRMDEKGRSSVAVPSMLIMGAALLCTPLTTGMTSLLMAACMIGFGNGIASGLVMTIGADLSPRTGRAHFLGVWRVLTDLGLTAGPALLSLLSAVFSLGAGIAVTGLIAFAAAAQLAYWIPRARGSDAAARALK